MISSFIDGRVRLRTPALTDPAIMEQVVSIARAQEGVHTVTPNTRTGSLLVEYDPTKVTREVLDLALQSLREFLAPLEKPRTGKKLFPRISFACGRRGVGGKAELRLLGLSGGISLAGSLFSPRLHILSGLLFTALMARHVFSYRNKLL